MKRRNVLLGGLVTTAAISTGWSFLANPSDKYDVDITSFHTDRLEDKETYEEVTFWRKAYAAKPFTLVGDTNHTDPRIEFFFYSMRNIENMTAAGVRNIFLEGSPRVHAEYKDSIIKSPPPSPEDEYDLANLTYDEREELRGDAKKAFWAECERRGMKIHSPDTMDETIDEQSKQKLRQSQEVLTRDFIEECGSERGITDNFRISDIFRNPIKGLRDYFAASDITAQRKDDRALAVNILEKASKTGNVIFYGSLHLDGRATSLRNVLANEVGYNNLLGVNIYGEPQYYLGEDFSVPPDFAFMVSEKTAYQTGRKAFLELDRAPNQSAPALKN